MDDATFLQHLMEVTTEFEDLVDDLEPGKLRQSLQDLVDRYDALIDCLTEGRATLARVKVPRLSAAAQEKVLTAIARLEEDGLAVTNANVYKLVGGSHGKVEAFMKEWRRTPRKRETNGTHAIRATTTSVPLADARAPQPVPLVAPELAPQDQRARLEHYLGLARQRKADLEEEMAQLRVRAERFMPMSEVREFNRKIVGTERAIEAVQRDIVQYLSELSRLR